MYNTRRHHNRAAGTIRQVNIEIIPAHAQASTRDTQLTLSQLGAEILVLELAEIFHDFLVSEIYGMEEFLIDCGK